MARESLEAKRRRAKAVARALAIAYPKSTCALLHETPFQLLVATILSAQTTDLQVNKATRGLFAKFPTPEAMAAAPDGAIEAEVNTLGLWRNKARHIRELSQLLAERFDGKVPASVAELTTLPGVGRKTATAVLGTAFGMEAGVTVDTHMLRINRLLRLSTATDPDKMANELEKLLPGREWPTYTHRIIDHGRLVCVARRPRCGVCPLATLCPSAKSQEAGYRPKNDDVEPASAKGLSWRQRHAP